MAQKDKIELRRTTWFVVNIKARKNQKPVSIQPLFWRFEQ